MHQLYKLKMEQEINQPSIENQETPKSSAWIWILVILILVAVGVGVYLLLLGDGASIISGSNSIPQPPALPS